MEYLISAFLFVTVPTVVVGGIFLGLALIVGNKRPSVKACIDCGHVGKTKVDTSGSCLITFFLFLFFIIPGFVYAIWGALNQKETCEKCGARNVVPLDSPKGREIAAKATSPVSDHA